MAREKFIASAFISGLIFASCDRTEEVRFVNCSYDPDPISTQVYLQENALGVKDQLKVGQSVFLLDTDRNLSPFNLYELKDGKEHVVDPKAPSVVEGLSDGREYTITFTSKNWETYAKADIVGTC